MHGHRYSSWVLWGNGRERWRVAVGAVVGEGLVLRRGICDLTCPASARVRPSPPDSATAHSESGGSRLQSGRVANTGVDMHRDYLHTAPTLDGWHDLISTAS